MRTFAAIGAALLAFGARAQSEQPPPAPAAATAPAPESPPRGTFVLSEKSTITITGRAWAAFEGVQARGSTSSPDANNVKHRLRVTNDSSYLRLRGEYRLAENVKAFAQLETQFALDGQAAPFDSGRNTGVGLSGFFGTVMLGRWDSPYKVSTLQLDPYIGTGIAGYYNVFGQEPAGPNDADDRWNSRLTNGAQYWTPRWKGLQARLAYAAGESRTSTLKPSIWSANLTWENGPVYLAAAWERRIDCANAEAQANPACTGALLGGAGKDEGLRLGGSYRVKPTWTKVALAWEKLKSSADAVVNASGVVTSPAKDLRRYAWFASVVQGLGGEAHQLNLTGGVATAARGSNVFTGPEGTRDTGARFFTVGYQYNWTKDLNLFAFYTRITNQHNAAYRFGSRGFGVKDGADPQGWGGGIHFLF